MRTLLVLALFLNIALFGNASLAGSSDYVRQVPGNFLSFMRSNPAWSWAWYQENKNSYGAELSVTSQEVGIVGGDIKPDNIDIVLTPGAPATLGIIDFDDGGKASLLGDLFHSLVYNEIWPINIAFNEALDLYTSGVNNSPLSGLQSLDKISEQNRILNPRKSNSKKLEKMKNSDQEFLSQLKLIAINSASPEVQQLYKDSKSYILNELKKIGKALKLGVRIKESGGSMNIPRFTVLVETESRELKIIEFKLQVTPAVAALGLPQDSHLTRLQDLALMYRPYDNLGAVISFLETPQGTFIVREHVEPEYDGGRVPSSSSEAELYRNYVRHMFWWLGNIHGLQNPKYKDLWNGNKEKIKGALQLLVNDHVKASKALWAPPFNIPGT